MIAKKNLSYLLLLASALLVLPSLRAALPNSSNTNLTVGFPSTVGTVTPNVVSATELDIGSTAPITVLNWGAFWDGSGAGGTSASGDLIHFQLPLATSSILNVVGGGATVINGSLTSNGKLFILNPSGITIGATGSINAAAFYASTVQENLSYFEQNGNLQVFTSTPPVSPTTGAITLTNGATITTTGNSGDVRLAANGITLDGGTVTGNVYLVDTGAATPAAISVGVSGTTTISGNSAGNLSIVSNGAAVTLSDGSSTSVSGNLVITSAGGAVDLANTAATTTTVTGTSTVRTTANAGNGNVSATAGTFISGATTITTGTGSAVSDGTVTIGALQLGANPITITGGATSLTDTTDTTLTLGNMTVSGNLSITTTGNLTTQNFGSTAVTPAVVTVNGAASTISLTADSGHAGGKTLSFNGSGAENFVNLFTAGATGGDTETITTTGNINLVTSGNLIFDSLSLTSTGGAITEDPLEPLRNNINNVGVSTLTVSAPTINLPSVENELSGTLVLKGGGTGGVTIAELGTGLTIGNGTSVTGNASISYGSFSLNQNNNIALGSASPDAISFGGNLTISLNSSLTTTSQQITTAAGTLSVGGKTTITSTGTSAAAANNAITLGTPGGTDTFGGAISTVITGAGGPITYYGSSGIALGATNTGNTTSALAVTSTLTGTANSGISNPTGAVTAGSLLLSSGTLVSSSNVQIGSTTSPAAITGTVEVDTANNLSLINSLATTVVAGTNPILGKTAITQSGTGAASAVTFTDAVSSLSIADTGTSPTGSVAVTIPTGNVALTNWTVGGDATVTVGVTASDGSITLGSGINDGNLSTTTFSSVGTHAAIADTASSPVSIYGAVIFNSDGPINVSNNTSSSLGGIKLNATTANVVTNNSNITYTEGSGTNLQGITVPGSYTGTIAVTSVNSIVLETSASVLTLPLTATLTTTANSINGAVLLNAAGATNAILAPISVTATGNSAIATNQNLTLGSVNISAGNFTADTTALLAATITEGTGATVVVSGSGNFITQGGALAVGQTGNKFGTLTIDTTDGGLAPAGADATIKQFTTSAYKSVLTGTGVGAGNFSATSENGAVTETGNAGVLVGGTTTLAASSGGIAFNATGNNFSGGALKLTTTGSASITDTNGVTQLGAGTNVSGGLTVTNTNAAGVIKDNGSSGNVTVGGTLFLSLPTGGSGDVDFVGAANSIAALEIKAGTGSNTFFDNASLILEPGTIVSGPTTIASGGSITTANGPMSFAAVNFNANGSITLTSLGMNFTGQVTAVVTGGSSDVNLSALSLANNFSGINPSATTTNNATLYQPPGP